MELVQEGALSAAALRVRLLHDQLRVDLAGKTGLSGSATGPARTAQEWPW